MSPAQLIPSTALQIPALHRGRNARKRAQVQMAESITAIIIVTLLIIFGVIFYSKMQEGNIAETKKSEQALSAVQLAQRLSSLPELSCSSAAAQDTSCIDYHKALVFATAMSSSNIGADQLRSYYFELFGNARIELDPVYVAPDSSIPFQPFLLYENNASSHQNIKPTFIPFSVMNNLDHETYLGVLVVSSYSG